ncbi:hypothetical protein HZA87_02425 [Candidatus Uhrbacteria bacterium]|nr:hypothetical protein [Candidatus Uhrbacteria bacterium]
MSDRTKKLLLVGGFVLSVFAIAFLLYWLFFKGAIAPAPTVEPTVEGTGELPTSGEGAPGVAPEGPSGTTGLQEAEEVAHGGLTQTTELTTGAVYNAVLSGDGASINYYNAVDGRFYTINADGEVVALSDKQFPEAENVEWNKDSEKALIEFPDGTNIIYDFSAEKQVTLPEHWEDFDFSPTSDEIIGKSIALDESNRYLVIASDDGSQVQAIAELGENEDKVDVNWSPNDQVVAFANTAKSSSSSLDRHIIYPVGKNQENFKGLVVEGLNFDSLWSPTGKQLLYSVTGDYSNNKPLLWVVDATASTMGENRTSLGLNTWVDKCTWSSASSVYCGVPIDLPANAGLQRSLYQDKPDALYKLDLTSNKASLVAIPEEATSMNDLWVSDDESMLYFMNSSGQLELLKLK